MNLRRTWEARRMFDRLVAWTGVLPSSWEPALYDAAERFDPDLILVIPLNALHPSMIARLRRDTRAQIVGWFQDHIATFGTHRFLLADYDALFFKDRHIVERLRDFAGMTTAHYLPEACEPSRHHPVRLTRADLEAYGCDLMTYGNLYPYRARLLEGVADQLRLYGERPAPWMTHRLRNAWAGRAVHDDEKIKAVLAAKIVINTSHFGEVKSANARAFEVAGISGFQVTDSPGIGEYFVPGEEIIVFKGPKMLSEVIDHYRSRSEQRELIAQRGHERAYRDHTYDVRFKEMFRILGIQQDLQPSTTNREVGE